MEQAKLAEVLLSAIAARCPAAAHGWLAAGVRRKDANVTGHFAAAARRLGRARLELDAAETETLAGLGLDWPTETWTLDEAARAALLLSAAARLPAARFETLFEELHRFGDGRERAALMRVLALLPQPSRFLPWARRTAWEGLEPSFSALARDNPYPGRHFPDEALEQLALKAARLGPAPGRVLGLERRRGAHAVLQEASRASA